jgi:hypothetical protein
MILSQSREGAKGIPFQGLSWRLGAFARDPGSGLEETRMLSRSHGATEKPLKPTVLNSSASPRLRERTGVSVGKTRMFSRRRGGAETRRTPMEVTASAFPVSPCPRERPGLRSSKSNISLAKPRRREGNPISRPFLASLRLRERSGFWSGRNPNALTEPRRHGEAAEADSPEFLRVSAPPRENRGFGWENPNVLAEARRRGEHPWK